MTWEKSWTTYRLKCRSAKSRGRLQGRQGSGEAGFKGRQGSGEAGLMLD